MQGRACASSCVIPDSASGFATPLKFILRLLFVGMILATVMATRGHYGFEDE